MDRAARVPGIRLRSLEVRGPDDFKGAIEAARGRAGALVVLSDSGIQGQIGTLMALAAKARLPAMLESRALLEWGALLSYGPDVLDLPRRAVSLVDKILKGARPADLPVEQPTRIELAINLKAAKALALTFPPSILVRADLVIQ